MDAQIIATKVISAESLAENRDALSVEIERLTRERGRLERELRVHTGGHRLGVERTDSPVTPMFGDVVLVMVNTGTGEEISTEIAKHLGI